ncbi:MAG: hypothetical protein HYZ09_00950 [Candidatus Kerfeldbacteria bacterium]|nr:hypothetical protein [Candidatus Kerfeldbacteria bacterium]
MNRKPLLFLAATSALVLSLSVSTRSAQAITVIPPTQEFLNVRPGETIDTKVKVFNEEATPKTIYASTANFGALDETGTPNILAETDQSDLAGWMKVDREGRVVQPGERLEFAVKIEVPADAPPGGHYAAVLISPEPPAPAGDSTQVAISQKVASLVLVGVEGVIKESGSIAGFTTAGGRKTFNRLPVDFLIRFINSGNVHLRPTGEITIRNLLGGTSSTLAVNPGILLAVLPQQVRKFDATWEKEALAGERGTFFQELGREWKNFGLGPYTAELVLQYGATKDKVAVANLQFQIFPWRILLLWLIMLVLVILLLVIIIRRYNRWIVARSQPPKDESPTRSQPAPGDKAKAKKT